MTDRDEEIEKAKRLAAGPWGTEMCKFPLRFSKPAFFGLPPSKDISSKINNGTVTLVDLGNGPLAITCFHVLSEYRKQKNENERTIFQIGECLVDPDTQLVSESEELDIAVISLSKAQVEEITKGNEIGACVYSPVDWPPREVTGGEFVCFGGFPGKLREWKALDELSFGSYSSGASRVTTSNDSYFVSQLEREYWIQSFSERGSLDLVELGGMSGGPAFVHRGLHFEFVGLIYEFSSSYELLYLRHAGVIGKYGEIQV